MQQRRWKESRCSEKALWASSSRSSLFSCNRLKHMALLLDYCWVFNRKKKHSSLWGFFCSYCWHAFIITSDHCWTQVVFEEREGKKGAPDVCGGPPARKRSWYIYSELEGQPRGHFIPFFLTGWPLYHVLSTGRASKRALSPKMEHKPVTLTLGQSALR